MKITEIFSIRPTVPKNLESLKSAWTRMRIEFEIYETDEIITLERFIIPKNKRQKGLGSKAMRILTDYADKTQQVIQLTPTAELGSTDIQRLKNFYRKFKFVDNSGSNADYRFEHQMYREPSI